MSNLAVLPTARHSAPEPDIYADDTPCPPYCTAHQGDGQRPNEGYHGGDTRTVELDPHGCHAAPPIDGAVNGNFITVYAWSEPGTDPAKPAEHLISTCADGVFLPLMSPAEAIEVASALIETAIEAATAQAGA